MIITQKEISIIRQEQRQKNKLLKRARSFAIRIFFHVFDRFFHASCKQDKTFTIISNNCWGGVIYEYFGMQKLSPTVGLYFFAKDYIKFVSNLEYYLSLNIKFIDASQSKYFELLRIKGQLDKPIGVLDDVEIVFLHYSSKDEAYKKWIRRVDRINWNNLIVKFSEQNLCTKEDIIEFSKLAYPKKIIFTKKKYGIKDEIVLPFYRNKISLLDDIPEYRFRIKKIRKHLGF